MGGIPIMRLDKEEAGATAADTVFPARRI